MARRLPPTPTSGLVWGFEAGGEEKLKVWAVPADPLPRSRYGHA